MSETKESEAVVRESMDIVRRLRDLGVWNLVTQIATDQTDPIHVFLSVNKRFNAGPFLESKYNMEKDALKTVLLATSKTLQLQASIGSTGIRM